MTGLKARVAALENSGATITIAWRCPDCGLLCSDWHPLQACRDHTPAPAQDRLTTTTIKWSGLDHAHTETAP